MTWSTDPAVSPAKSTTRRERLPKPPIHKPREKRRTDNPPEVQALIERLATESRPASGTCNWCTAGTWDAPPIECGRPVVADWFRGKRRISSLCDRHDAFAKRFSEKTPDLEHRRVPRW